MESMERLRKKLTSNDDAELFSDSLMEEEDLQKSFTRHQFANVI